MRALRAAAVLLAVLMLSGSANAQFFDIHIWDLQGYVTDSGGSPVSDGLHSLTFKIYDDEVAGNLRWTSGPRQVELTNGLFTFYLGDSTTLPYDLFSSGDVWLGVTVDGDPEMTPRIPFASTSSSAVAASVHGDVHTSRGELTVGNAPTGGGSDSGVVVVTGSKAVDHRGHVTILKISGGGSDTTEVLTLDGDPRSPSVQIGDGNDPDSGVVVSVAKPHKHRGHVTILKISNGGQDTTEVLTLDGDPSAPSLQFGDGGEPDSGVVVTTGKKHKHRGHVTILKISNGGQDTTEVLSLDGDPAAPSLQFGDGSEPDSGVVLTAGKKHKHRGHVTILKISNGGQDTTQVLHIDGDPDRPIIQFGDGGDPDSSVVLTTGMKHKHRGHVTILKISNGGQDTTEVLTLDGDPASPSIQLGDGDDPDSGVVVSVVKPHKHNGHVTILKISNGGQDTTNMVSIDGGPDTAAVQLGGGSGGSILMRTTSSQGSGMLGVNTLAPGYEVDVVGTICATGGMCSPSDLRLKKGVEPLLGALSLVNTLRPVHFDWRTEEFPARRLPSGTQTGLIAQDVLSVFPEAVTQGSDGMYAVDYARLTPLLIGAIQEQQTQIDELKALVNQLASRIPAAEDSQYGLK